MLEFMHSAFDKHNMWQEYIKIAIYISSYCIISI